MVKIVLPMLVAALAAASSAASADVPDCNDFPEFRARMSCYEAVSRALPANNPALTRPATSPQTPAAPARRHGSRVRRAAR